MAKKDTSIKAEVVQLEQVELEPNEKLSQFIKDNKINFQVSVFEDKYVYVPGKGFLFFTEPQLIYKATNK